MWTLFLDDTRAPFPQFAEMPLEQARSYAEAIKMMEEKGCPSFVSFDHDLGEGPTGKDVAEWMVCKDMEEGGKWMPPNFNFAVHSANFYGAESIRSYLTQYLEKKKEECK